MDQNQPPPIGFEMQTGAVQPQHQYGVSPYPDLTTPENNVAPIGFEAQEKDIAGPTEVIVTEEKIPMKSRETSDVGVEDSMFFRDGRRRIDYVLAYEPGTSSNEEKRAERRKIFQDNLVNTGLQLEHEGKEKSKTGKTCFVKVHAPWDILTKNAEIMNMNMPLAPNDMELELESCWDKCPGPFDLDESIVKPEPNYFTAPFNRDRVEQFIVGDKESFFTNAQRSRIVHNILARTVFEDMGDKTKNKFGIKKLVNNGTYEAAYPLHDGKYSSPHSLLTHGPLNDRHLLYGVWARPGVWYKKQPLDQIRTYFGEKIGIYFAWIGFYTQMLIPAAIVGVVVFIYGLATFMSDIPSDEICNNPVVKNLTMCPLCDTRCPYWKLEDSCIYSRATYLFDNYATVAFAAFMALWASFFHEFWKRKQAEIEYDWDVADFENEEEILRPEFEATVRRTRVNPINQMEEPFVPLWSKCFRYTTTITVIFIFLFAVVAAVLGVIVYRIVIASLLYASNESLIRQRATLLASITGALINLVIILILNFIYQRIAVWLTNLEQHRTETEWEDAFTFKMYLFQFVNFYSTIFYIAFFKGRLIGRPGAYDRGLAGIRPEECDPSGCLIEVCIQLGIVMVGKQTFNNFKELLLPKIIVFFKSRQAKKDKSEDKIYSRWEQDYHLAEMPALGLFDEYLEMVVQFGFVTIFVAAFPLAPMFALLNNIVEIRLDAYKFATQWRRPLAARAEDIGIWFGILRGISAIAVISNAVIIAFTSEFIPKVVYQYSKFGAAGNYTLGGYVQFSLSSFRTADFEASSFPQDPKIDIFGNVTECWYRDFRDDYTNGYSFSEQFWYVMTARLAFVVMFENMIVFATWLIMYLVPDTPYFVKVQGLREKYLGKEAIYDSEAIKATRTASRNEDRPLY